MGTKWDVWMELLPIRSELVISAGTTAASTYYL